MIPFLFGVAFGIAITIASILWAITGADQ